MAKEKQDRGVQGFFEDIFSPVGDAIGGTLRSLSPGAAYDADQRRESQDLANQERVQRILKMKNFNELYSGVENLKKEREATSLDGIKSIGTVYNVAKAIGDEDLMNSAAVELKKKIADSGLIPASVSAPAPTTQQSDTAKAIYNTTFDALKKTQTGPMNAGRASDEATKASLGKYFVEADKAGIPRSAAESIYIKLSKEKMDRKGIMTDKVYPKGFTASLFFPRAQGPPKPEDTQESTSEKPAGKLPDEKPVKPLEDYTQVATKNFPVDNTPKSYAALGITEPADQQSMQEIETAAPKGLDVQSIASSYPEGFKAIMKALQKHKKPNGKPYNMEDVIRDLGRL